MELKPLLMGLYRAANMQRWNDSIRPVELRELDKQAHKMVLAYFLGRWQEDAGDPLDWTSLIEAGLFQLLERVVLTDLKPQVHRRILEEPETYSRLRGWLAGKVREMLEPASGAVFERYLHRAEDERISTENRVLEAAHALSSLWEFEIIERSNPSGYGVEEAGRSLRAEIEGFADLEGMRRIASHRRYRDFVDLTGTLRFQVRWSHLAREPRTSVLGHMLVVAVISYMMAASAGAGPRRLYNDCFTGLFHDLPEALTRDIISPVKTSVEGLEGLIKRLEAEEMERRFYAPGLIPPSWHEEMRLFTEEEFSDAAFLGGRRTALAPGELEERYAGDEHNPRDGRLVRAADALAAFTEAWLGARNNPACRELVRARDEFMAGYRDAVIGGVDIGAVFREFAADN